MKYVDEYRDAESVRLLSEKIKSIITRNWNIMEICGGQTHTILKYKIEELLPPQILLIHGPGCPVCVTPIEMIDKAILLASRPDIILVSYGDMLRVPGTDSNLLEAKSKGGNVKMIYSPLDAVKIAEQNPDKKIVFFGVGFETTAPANAFTIFEAERRGLKNYFMLCSHVLVPPAIECLLKSGKNSIHGILTAGHVCTVMGYEEYIPLAEKYKTPMVVTGFEPVDILSGLLMVINQLENGNCFIENQYGRAVRKEGNIHSKKIISDVFEITDRNWRGIGVIPQSGLKIKSKYSHYDAETVFNISVTGSDEPDICIAGEILQGLKKPGDCPAFRKECKPEIPLGAPMVSSEGACSAYYRYTK